METFFHKHSLYLAIILFIVALLLGVSSVMAATRPATVIYGQQSNNIQSRAHATGLTASELAQNTGTASGLPGQATQHVPANVQQKLEGVKLQVCQRIENTVITRSIHLADLVTKMELTFASIAKGVEDYYTNHVLPTGSSLPTYTTLVDAITSAQNSLTPLVTAAQSDASSFSCSSSSPSAALTQYRTDMQAVIKGLQNYRTSIKNLIVAVRTLPSTSAISTPSAAPTSGAASSSAATQ